MDTLSNSLITVWTIAKVALGLGFVVFIHELGHFAVAKWNGVKVTKFSIGFGPSLASYRRGVGLRIGTGSRPPGPDDPPSYGETEYVLAALPLGGFVAMLGEGTDESPKADPEAPITDPRAFKNKSVGARMAIITAGVIMNIILGWVCFLYVHTQPGLEQPAKIGGVIPGSPAYMAGLRIGDEIVAINDRQGVDFMRMVRKVSHSGADEKVKLTVKRPGVAGEITLEIEPRRNNGDPVPTIGMLSASSLGLAPNDPFLRLPGQDALPAATAKDLEGGGTIVAVGPEGGKLEPVTDHDDFVKKSEAIRDRPMVIEVDRKASPEEKPPIEAKHFLATIPTHRFLDFGFRLKAGPIVALRPDSPASKAGLKPGDLIVAVDGRKDFDPMRLPEDIRALAGRAVKLLVDRPVVGKPAESIEVSITPEPAMPWVDPTAGKITQGTSFDIPGLGLSMAIMPKVEAVKPGSAASKAGINPGDSIDSITIKPLKIGDQKPPKPVTFILDGPSPTSWAVAEACVQEQPWAEIELKLNKAKAAISLKPEVESERFRPSRGLGFLGLLRPVGASPFGQAASEAGEDTYDNVTSIYKVFRGLAQRRVGGDAFNGLPTIAAVAYQRASSGWISFVQFLGILSINLAVLNFLPIPPLDGGQFVFLTAEKVRGKPLPEAALAYATIGGLVFVLGLVLVVNIKDVYQMATSYFF